MIEFPFWCPAEQKVANAKADPVGLLFGGTPELTVTCVDCETVYKAEVEVGKIVVKGPANASGE